MAKRRKKADLDESYGLMFGFLNNEPEVTAFLQIVQDGEELYDFVFDERDATQFPFVNNAQIKGFATPDKWLEYFKTEPSLKDWTFHVVKRQRKHVS